MNEQLTFSETYAGQLIQDLKTTKLYSDLLAAAQVEVRKTSLKVSDLKQGVQTGLLASEWNNKLRNAIYRYIRQNPPPGSIQVPQEHSKEPLAHLRKAQQAWERKILKSLNSMCTELSIPLARRRPEREQRELLTRWSELGTEGPGKKKKTQRKPIKFLDLSSIRPVYAPKDFLEVVIALRNPNYMDGSIPGFSHFWGIVQIPLQVKDIHQLRLQYSEMSINQCQIGVDDNFDGMDSFASERFKLGLKVLAANHSPVAQEFSKKGCPVSLRADLWQQMLGVEVDKVDMLFYEQLKKCVLQHDLLVDNLLYKDVKLTATNDDQYFVFEDYLYQVLLPFSRDTVVLRHFRQNSANPPKSYIRGKMGVEEFAVFYPPNGVIPFHGFAMYAAPLCYLYSEPVKLYYIFREMYMQYFFRLHSISSHPQGIVALSLLFEILLQTNEPVLFAHLKSVGCQPLRIAFKWLMRAYSGFLASDQVLLLWDKILAYNSLEVLSVLAMAIFSFRKTNLMKVQTFAAAEAVMADLTTLQVLPLIQLSLFSK